ncbi:penicillin acylase family protein, partial [PVC group bacterium]|nr:penicillin acylase family protein [PVC group bacterium]
MSIQKGGMAYVAALACADAIGYLHSKYLFMVAKDYKDVMRALEICEIMPQNVMVADTGGNIYYQRTGRVPIRPAGYDFSRPVDGTTSRTAWRGLHKTADFV